MEAFTYIDNDIALFFSRRMKSILRACALYFELPSYINIYHGEALIHKGLHFCIELPCSFHTLGQGVYQGEWNVWRVGCTVLAVLVLARQWGSTNLSFYHLIFP